MANQTPAPKVANFGAPKIVVSKQPTAEETPVVKEPNAEEPTPASDKQQVVPEPDTAPVVEATPVIPEPIEKAGEALEKAEIDNQEPVAPVEPYEAPAVPETKEPETPKAEEPAKPADPPPAPKPGEDEVLEQLRAPAKAEMVYSETEDKADLLINRIVLGKKDDLIEDLRKFYPTEGSVAEAMKDETSLFQAVRWGLARGWATGSANTISGVLMQNDKVGDRLTKQAEEPDMHIGDTSPTRLRTNTVRMSGKEAKLMLASKLGGLRRVCLLNSGFWVLLRAPKLDELQEIFTTVDMEGQEIGRTLGAHYALVSDLFLKQKFVEALLRHNLIYETNFTGINDKGAFMRNLSYHDYDTLVHGIASLMSRKGFRMNLICPKCGEISVDENVDMASIKFLNRELLNERVREWWSTTKNARGEAITRSEADLKKYREEILGHKTVIRQTINLGAEPVVIELELTPPVMSKYFSTGEMLINQLNATIDQIAEGEKDKTDMAKAALMIHGYQLLAPWINELRLYEADGKTLTMSTGDTNVIVDYLDQTIQDTVADSDMFDELDKFVANTRFNYFGSFSIECPKCHAKPETELDNFFPIDIQTAFFGLLFRRSAPVSSQGAAASRS